MNKKDLKKYKIPKTPGVYIFRGARKKILYIGKATNLQGRVRSYFGKNLPASRGPILVKMLESAREIEWQETDSVLEALILEANLIKKHQPIYNTKEKSDTSFNYVVIIKEDFPRIVTMRGKELLSNPAAKYKTMFGPFTNAALLKEALKIIRKIFPYRDTCRECPRVTLGHSRCKPCFDAQLGLCPGICSGEITKKEYTKTIRNIILLLQGKKQMLVRKLKKEMEQSAKKEEFEYAGTLRKKIFALEHINDVALIKDGFTQTVGHRMSNSSHRIEGYDVAHTSETARVGVMTVIENGKVKKSEYRRFIIKTKEQGDVAALKEILIRRLKHTEWKLPILIVVDGAKQQINAAKKVLKEFGYKIPIAAVTKDEHHKPKQILSNRITEYNEKDVLLANAEAHRFALSFHRKKRDKIAR